MLHYYLALHLAVILFGVAGIFGKLLPLSPFVIVAGRTFFASVTLTLITLPQRGNPQNHRIPILTLLLLGLILALHWITFFYGIKLSTVAIGLLTYASYPVFVTFLESARTKRAPSSQNIIALLAVIIGIILIVPEYNLEKITTQGAFWGVLSGILFAILTIFNRLIVQKVPAITLTKYENIGATLGLIPMILNNIPQISWPQWGLLILLGVFCTALAHWLFNFSLKNVSAQVASIAAALEPVYGIFLAYLILGEGISFRTLLGGLIIITACFIST